MDNREAVLNLIGLVSLVDLALQYNHISPDEAGLHYFDIATQIDALCREPELDPELLKGIKAGLKARKEGKVKPWSQVKKELNIPPPDELREWIFDKVTDPPCHYWENGTRHWCEFWDVQGHYCFLKDMHEDTKKCPLVVQLLQHITPEIEARKDKEWEAKLKAAVSTAKILGKP